MQAIILAGGFGTRLQEVVSNVPKPMAPINSKPFLEYILEELYKHNFTKVILAVGYKKECIINYFGNKYKTINIVYSMEDEPLGTGGCIMRALNLVDDDYVFVLNGDTFFKIDYKKMASFQSLTIACKKMHKFSRYGQVVVNNGIINCFKEKEYIEEGYINGGIYYLPKNIFSKYKLGNKFSIEKDFFEPYVNFLKIRAFLSDGYFIDIGIPSDYEKAQKELKNE